MIIIWHHMSKLTWLLQNFSVCVYDHNGIILANKEGFWYKHFVYKLYNNDIFMQIWTSSCFETKILYRKKNYSYMNDDISITIGTESTTTTTIMKMVNKIKTYLDSAAILSLWRICVSLFFHYHYIFLFVIKYTNSLSVWIMKIAWFLFLNININVCIYWICNIYEKKHAVNR